VGNELAGEVVRTVVKAYTLVPTFDPPLASKSETTSATEHALDVLHTVERVTVAAAARDTNAALAVTAISLDDSGNTHVAIAVAPRATNDFVAIPWKTPVMEYDIELPVGRVVQVETLEPKFKAPGTKRLKLKCEKPLSSYAFSLNLHHYTQGAP